MKEEKQKTIETNVVAPTIFTHDPGMYNIDNETYQNGGGISRGAIMKFIKSPYHYWDRYINPARVPETQTEAMAFGELFHTLVLEPGEFDNRYLVKPKLDGRTKVGIAKAAELQAIKGDRRLIEATDKQLIDKMAARIQGNVAAKSLIENGLYERSLYFRNPETGLMVKARPDILQLERGFIGDVKTAADADFHSFESAVWSYGYHIQAAIMQDAIYALFNITLKAFVFIVIEKRPPFAMAIYPLDESAIEFGRQHYVKKLIEIKECMDTNKWPEYETRSVSIPAWAIKYI